MKLEALRQVGDASPEGTCCVVDRLRSPFVVWFALNRNADDELQDLNSQRIYAEQMAKIDQDFIDHVRFLGMLDEEERR